MVFPLPCYADDRELYNQIIDIRRKIARPEALVMIVELISDCISDGDTKPAFLEFRFLPHKILFPFLIIREKPLLLLSKSCSFC